MTKRKLSAAVFLLLFILLIILFSIYEKKTHPEPNSTPISETGFYLNTAVTLTIYDSQDTSLLKKSMELCKKYEEQFSRTIETSEIYQFNHGLLEDAHGNSHISRDTASVIQKGLHYSQLSKGAFDLTIGPVSSLWDFTSDSPAVPEDALIQKGLPLVGYENLSLKSQELKTNLQGMQLDLGAIAKGYIADRIKEYLVSQGVKSATINLGGNVLCIGSRPNGSPFRIGIQKPFSDRNETAAILGVTDRSVVTSGIYERYFEKNGILYHHILDPLTGYPCDNNLASVTILSDQSVDGDGLSTACFLMGLDAGMRLVDSLEHTEALFLTKDNEYHYSKGFPKN